jgi:hypothetical protein
MCVTRSNYAQGREIVTYVLRSQSTQERDNRHNPLVHNHKDALQVLVQLVQRAQLQCLTGAPIRLLVTTRDFRYTYLPTASTESTRNSQQVRTKMREQGQERKVRERSVAAELEGGKPAWGGGGTEQEIMNSTGSLETPAVQSAISQSPRAQGGWAVSHQATFDETHETLAIPGNLP